MALTYTKNPKHKDPWQPGKRGTLCRQGLTDDEYNALKGELQKLLEESVEDGDKRYATYLGRAYCAQQDQDSSWHGYPVGYVEVSEVVWREWVANGDIKRSDVFRWWKVTGQ